jgi:hypothetical protein
MAVVVVCLVSFRAPNMFIIHPDILTFVVLMCVEQLREKEDVVKRGAVQGARSIGDPQSLQQTEYR